MVQETTVNVRLDKVVILPASVHPEMEDQGICHRNLTLRLFSTIILEHCDEMPNGDEVVIKTEAKVDYKVLIGLSLSLVGTMCEIETAMKAILNIHVDHLRREFFHTIVRGDYIIDNVTVDLNEALAVIEEAY